MAFTSTSQEEHRIRQFLIATTLLCRFGLHFHEQSQKFAMQKNFVYLYAVKQLQQSALGFPRTTNIAAKGIVL